MELLTKHTRNHCTQAGHDCLSKISKGTASKILSTNEIRPHKIRYYLERRDPMHEEKMKNVLLVYKKVQVVQDSDENVYMLTFPMTRSLASRRLRILLLICRLFLVNIPVFHGIMSIKDMVRSLSLPVLIWLWER